MFSFLSLLLLASAASADGSNLVNICPSSNESADSQGIIYSPFLLIKGGLSCSLTLNDIPARTWFGLFNIRFNLEKQAEHCKDQKLHLSVSHPAKPTDYLCGESLPKVLYTAYSSDIVSIQFTLSTPVQYDRDTNFFQLEYRVAKVIYDGRNTIESAPIQTEGSVVSHSSYPQSNYGTNIDSSLKLTNARLASTLQLQFYKLNFAPGCLDYLGLAGATGVGGDEPKFCMKDSRLLNQWSEYIVTSAEVQFHFIASSDVGGLGFRLDYRVVPGTGCERPDIPHTSISVDTKDPKLHTFTISCTSGAFITGNATVLRILCTGGKWWPLSSCTDGCSSVDIECFIQCNITSSELYSIQCTDGTDNVYDEEISMRAYIGTVAGIVGFLLLLVVIGTIIACRRRRRSVKEKKEIGITFSSTPPLDTSHNDSGPYTEETLDSDGYYLSSDESTYPAQQTCRGSVDGYHVPMLHRPPLPPIKPLKPPTDSLVAPHNSTALPGGHNLIDQSDVYLLAAPSGGYNSTALPEGRNLHVPFDTAKLSRHPMHVGLTSNITAPSEIYPSSYADDSDVSEQTYAAPNYCIPQPAAQRQEVRDAGTSEDNVYHLAADVHGKVQTGEQNPYHLPVPIDQTVDTFNINSPPQRRPADGASLAADDSKLIEPTSSPGSASTDSTPALADGRSNGEASPYVNVSPKVRLRKTSGKNP